ncbi:hypothetical protein AB8E26_20280 [Stenotrophomonas rhizophila]
MDVLHPGIEEKFGLVLLLLADGQVDQPSRASAPLPITFLVPPCRL